MLILLVLIGIYLLFMLQGRWDGSQRYTVVIQNMPEAQENRKSLLVLSIEPFQEQAIVLSIPPDVLLDVPFGYKAYPAASVFRLGQLDRNRGGGKLLLRSVESSLSIPINGYWVNQKPIFSLPETYDELKTIKKENFNFFAGLRHAPSFFSTSVDTNIALTDRLRLWNAIRKLRSDQITFMNLGQTTALVPAPNPDGTSAYTFDVDAYDTIIASHFEDSFVRNEQISIEVVNATGQERQAAQFSRILEHMGANVVSRSTGKTVEKSACSYTLMNKRLAESVLVERLKAHFGCSEASANPANIQADITVILGSGYVE